MRKVLILACLSIVALPACAEPTHPDTSPGEDDASAGTGDASSAAGDTTAATTAGSSTHSSGSGGASSSSSSGTASSGTGGAGTGRHGPSVACGAAHTCALTQAGGAKCWGANIYGQLGIASMGGPNLLPLDVSGLSAGLAAIYAGGSHSCALMQSGGIKCWGENHSGQLGDGTTQDRSVPVDVAGLGPDVVAVDVGDDHTCAVMTDGGLKCWGAGQNGQLGDGLSMDSAVPVDVVGLEAGVISMAATYSLTCAVESTGDVRCWGWNGWGLGDGFTISSALPVKVLGLSAPATSVSTDGTHVCVLLEGGAVECWGYNGQGELGDGSTVDSALPVEVAGLGSAAIAIFSGEHHSCARLMDGTVKCWGDNSHAQLGDGTTLSSPTPVNVVGLEAPVVETVSGSFHECARVGPDGRGLQCWGYNGTGALGDGMFQDPLVPVHVVGF